jgi:hypothetical protein
MTLGNPTTDGIGRTLHAGGIPLFLFAAWLLSGCSTLRVPSGYPESGASGSVRAQVEGVTLTAKPIVGRDAYWGLFDEDLPRLGIAAAWVTLRSDTGEEMSIQPRRWSLRAGDRRYPALRADDVLGRYYEGARKRIYSLQADRDARARLERISLQPGKAAAGTQLEGFVFFGIQPSAADSWTRQATLVARDVVIGAKRKVLIEVPLYAHP